MNSETMGLAVEIADDAAREVVASALRPMPGAGSWLSTRLPRGLEADDARAVRRALRYLHRRGLVWDHPAKAWVTLRRPLSLRVSRARGGMAA